VRLTDRAAGRVVVRITRAGLPGVSTRVLRVRAARTTTKVVTLPRSGARRALVVLARFSGDASHLPATTKARVAARRG
jgi:hypothetical protein